MKDLRLPRRTAPETITISSWADEAGPYVSLAHTAARSDDHLDLSVSESRLSDTRSASQRTRS